MMGKKTGLGQGVHLLFGEEKEKYFDCDIEKIIPNQHQPRTDFKREDLEDLANSIREQGVIQPLLVRALEGGKYELVAGERRLRASRLAGLSQVPVIMIDIDGESSLLEIALIENIQRTDLNALEEAEAYAKLMEKFQYTQEDTAKKVGKKRSTIANTLRLLKLPKNIQDDIRSGDLSEGHGRALIKLLEDPEKLSEVRKSILENGLSVRQTEKLIKKVTVSGNRPKKGKEHLLRGEIPTSYKNALTTQLVNRLNSKVLITCNGNRGKIEIEYYSLDDLDRLTALLLAE
jgi:ParB family transcriptional regulator, chromosome partitioning protein